MKHSLTLFLIMGLLTANGQHEIGFAGKQFFGLSVSNADSTSAWYENVFQLRLLKEIKAHDGSVHVRIVGNENLLVEVIQPKDSKKISDLGIDPDRPFELLGIFKVGIYVQDIYRAEKYLKQKNVVVKHGVFDDADTQTKSLIVTDINKTLIQVMQRLK